MARFYSQCDQCDCVLTWRNCHVQSLAAEEWCQMAPLDAGPAPPCVVPAVVCCCERRPQQMQISHALTVNPTSVPMYSQGTQFHAQLLAAVESCTMGPLDAGPAPPWSHVCPQRGGGQWSGPVEFARLARRFKTNQPNAGPYQTNRRRPAVIARPRSRHVLCTRPFTSFCGPSLMQC